jgi:hypothetical protein
LRAWGAAVLRPYMIGDGGVARALMGDRMGLGLVGSKGRDLGNDRGYRVVVVKNCEGLSLNPHPHKPRVGHPNIGGCAQECGGSVVRRWWGGGR